MNKLLDKLPKPPLVKLYRSKLSKLYNELEHSLESWTRRDILMNSSRLEYNRDITLLNIQEFSYIPNEITDILKSIGTYHKKFTLEINNRYYEIIFILPCLETDISIKQANLFFNKCLKKMFLWLTIVQEHIRKGCSDSLTIHIIFTNHKKKLGEKNIILTPTNVNTAFTTSCKKNANICIYRKEEWFKVFVHETFHCLGLDFSNVDNTLSETLITDAFKVYNKKGIRVYEAYCELWAELLNTTIYAFLKSKTKEDFYTLFEKQINLELSFSLFQSTKVLNYHNLTYDSVLNSDCKTVLFKEDTHILSYYILKTILLFHLRDFEKWCEKNNVTMFQFNSNESNIKSFVELIITLSKKKSIKDIMHKYKKYIETLRIPLDIAETMRMTITEF